MESHWDLVKTVRYYRGADYMGWQKYSFKSRYFEILSWLRSDAAHSVKIGRKTISLDNINELPVSKGDFCNADIR